MLTISRRNDDYFVPELLLTESRSTDDYYVSELLLTESRSVSMLQTLASGHILPILLELLAERSVSTECAFNWLVSFDGSLDSFC